MIQIACNYSKELIDILKKDLIDVDWIKLANEKKYDEQFQHIDGIKSCLFHIVPCVMSEGHLDNWNIHRVKQAIYDCKSPHVGVHLRGVFNISDPTKNRDIIKKHVIQKIREWKKQIDVEYTIENMPLNRLPIDQHILTEPDFIRQVCEEAKIGLLLDLSHLKVSAHYLGMTESDYLYKLPLTLVKEIHVNGPRKDSEGYHDAHCSMREEDYSFLEEALKVTKPRMVTLEYGGDEERITCPDKLVEQIKRLKLLVAKY